MDITLGRDGLGSGLFTLERPVGLLGVVGLTVTEGAPHHVAPGVQMPTPARSRRRGATSSTQSVIPDLRRHDPDQDTVPPLALRCWMSFEKMRDAHNTYRGRAA